MGFAALYPSYELRPNSALVPRTQRSASSAMRCRAGAHVAANAVACWVPAQRSNAKSVAARPGHKRGGRCCFKLRHSVRTAAQAFS
ncbi:hypothetical protein TM239_15440 [Bradyrhizobium sp. TM239]|nr:hypothetical protein TM239_15440 [Bradyrhizobium sp. TM239]